MVLPAVALPECTLFIITTTAPDIERPSPTQNARRGRRWKTSQVPRPTKMGALLPKSVALAAVVCSTAVLNNARSQPKNAPPRSA